MQMKNIIFIVCFTAFVAMRVEHVEHIGPPPDPDISLDVSQEYEAPITADLNQALNVHQYRVGIAKVETVSDHTPNHLVATASPKDILYLTAEDPQRKDVQLSPSPPDRFDFQIRKVYQDKEIEPGSWELGSGIDKYL